MGELNSSLAKKFRGAASPADDGREELNRGDQLKVGIYNARRQRFFTALEIKLIMDV